MSIRLNNQNILNGLDIILKIMEELIWNNIGEIDFVDQIMNVNLIV